MSNPEPSKPFYTVKRLDRDHTFTVEANSVPEAAEAASRRFSVGDLRLGVSFSVQPFFGDRRYRARYAHPDQDFRMSDTITVEPISAREIPMEVVQVYGERFEIPKVIGEEVMQLRRYLNELSDKLTSQSIRAWEAETGRTWASLQAELAAEPPTWVLIDAPLP